MDHSNDSSRLTLQLGAKEEEFEAALLAWEELDASSLETLQAHPIHGRRLSHLQDAEAWLSEPSSAMPRNCPTAEELYDYGQGPGAAPLSRERRTEIDGHIHDCRACAELVPTLATTPPVPIEELLHSKPGDVVPSPRPARGPSPILDGPADRRPRWRLSLRLLPLAAAASILAALFLAPHLFTGAAGPLLPVVENLRGAEDSPLLYPREALLWIPSETALAGLPSGSGALFELAPVDGASRYRIEVLRTNGGAFERGERVALLRGQGRRFGPLNLAAGQYTWQAWAEVDGLERPLGKRDFVVREDPELLLSVRDLGSVAAVWALHEAGYRSDARELARSLPPSPERDAFIERIPGR